MLLFALAISLSAQVAHQEHHPPRDAKEYAAILEDTSRDEWQKPHEVIVALKLRADETIADIGAGSGYFSRRFAHHVAKVYAVDIDQRLLDMVKKGGDPKVQTVLAKPDDPMLPAASLDTIFFCDVLHHIENRPAYYSKLAKALKPGGRIVIVDFYKKKLPVGPPETMKLAEDQVIAELDSAGFRKTEAHTLLPYQYFLEFRKK